MSGSGGGTAGAGGVLLQIIRTRVMRFLVRGRVVEADPDAGTSAGCCLR